GALGSIAASRTARAFRIGGPSYTVCSEETSGASAIELAVRALQRGEIDCALAGAVGFMSDRRAMAAMMEIVGEGFETAFAGAAAVILMRSEDAEAAGCRLHGVIDGIGSAVGSRESLTETAQTSVERARVESGVQHAPTLHVAAGLLGHEPMIRESLISRHGS